MIPGHNFFLEHPTIFFELQWNVFDFPPTQEIKQCIAVLFLEKYTVFYPLQVYVVGSDYLYLGSREQTVSTNILINDFLKRNLKFETTHIVIQV